MPVAFYLVFLGQNHQIGKIQVLSGRADLVRLLCGVSGLVILGGPRLLAHLHHFWILKSIAQGGPEPWYLVREFWVFLFVLYIVMVAGLVYALWVARRGLTLIYHASRDQVEKALETLSLDSHFAQDQGGEGYDASPRLTADPWLRVVEIHWSEGMLPWKEKAEAGLQWELSQIRNPPDSLWLVPVGLGLGILGFLAFLNLSQAWRVLIQGI